MSVSIIPEPEDVDHVELAAFRTDIYRTALRLLREADLETDTDDVLSLARLLAGDF